MPILTVPLLCMKPESVMNDLWLRSPILMRYLCREGISLEPMLWDGTLSEIPSPHAHTFLHDEFGDGTVVEIPTFQSRVLILVSEDMTCMASELSFWAQKFEHVAFMNDRLLLTTGRFNPEPLHLIGAVVNLCLKELAIPF